MSTFGVSAPATLLSSWEKPFGRCGVVSVSGCVGALASRLLRGGKAGERPDSLDEQFSGTSGMVSLQRPLWIGTTLCCGVTEESHVLAVNLCHVTVGQLV